MNMTDLAKIAKAETKRWPDGKPVTFVTRDPSSPDMKLVVEKVYEMTADAVGTLISSANHGRTNRPAIVVVDSDQEIVRRVEATPGAIGIVDVYSITGGVAVVRIGGKLPLEPGYPLHGN
jgi:ABC-type phosphate transport system substrate-binding protein